VLPLLLPPSFLSTLAFHGSDSGAGPFRMAPVDGDPAVVGGVGELRVADSGRRRPTPGVDGPAGVKQGAQPPAGLRRELHPPARARLQRLDEQVHAGLCHHYGVELHNFAPNTILQAASFVAGCEGFLESRRTGTCGSIFSAVSSTLSPRAKGGHVRRFASAAPRSCCGTSARSCTCRVP
jgi:hypothetical protein